MFKKIAMLVVSAALALSLPCLAFADGSPTYTPIDQTGNNGSTISVQPTDADDAAKLVVEAASTPSSVSSIAVGTVIDTFSVYKTDYSPITSSLTLTFNVGKKYAGMTAYVYGLYGRSLSGDPSQLAKMVVDADGKISFTVDSIGEFADFTVSVDESTSGVAPDASSKSPSTGANPMTIAFAAGAAIALAGAVVVVRKKITE
jgi:LPXTG-motif cell wall-anchored protein